jgi:signal transduction histidine kinase
LQKDKTGSRHAAGSRGIPTMITVLFYTGSKGNMPDGNFMVGGREARFLIRCPVPSVPEAEDRRGSDAIVVLSSDSGRDALSLLCTVRATGDEIPFIIAVEKPDRGIAFEAIMQDAGYYLLPETTAEDTLGGLSKMLTQFLERKELRQTLLNLNLKLTLVGSVTRHDVMNQLTAIIGFNELLLMMAQDPKIRGYLQKERAGIEKIQRQFQYAKDYQNIGVEPPGWQVIKQVVGRMNDDLDLSSVNVTVTTGNATIFADPLFDKVIYNLFDNALRHGEGVSEIRVSSEERSSGVILVIEDNGTGIPAAIKEKIFERGYGKNTGWGLFLVREILEITGMTITECSEMGKGARFEIRIPRGSFSPDGCSTPATK